MTKLMPFDHGFIKKPNTGAMRPCSCSSLLDCRGKLLSFASRWRVISVGKNVQSVQTHLNLNQPELTQSHLIQWVTSRTILRKPQFLDSKSAVAIRVGSSPTPGTIRFHDKRPSSRMAFCFSGRCEEVYPQTLRPSDPQTHRLSGHQPLGLPSPQSIFCAMRHSTPAGSYRQNSFMRHGWVTSSVTRTP